MTQEELIKIVKQLNHVDLQGEAKDELTAKVLQMAADSVTLETLKNLVVPNRSSCAPVPEGEVAKTLGRKSRSGFTLSKKEIKSMPEKYRRIFACEDRIIPYRFHKGVYEAHYRRDGFNVFACAKNFDEMRKKFSAKLLEAMHGAAPEPYETQKEKWTANVRKALFSDYLKEWLDIKQKTCKESTVKEYEQRKSDASVRRQTHRGTDAADVAKIPFRLYRRGKTPHGRKTASNTMLCL